jgi:oligopeptide/dipeptide ABC transporter ATP-binding protein
MNPYFQIKNLKVNFKTFEGEKNVLDIERLTIEKGKAFGLVGESGTGKSVLAQTILGLLSIPPGVIKSGTIRFDGEDLLSKKDTELRKIRGKKIAMIFQDPMSTLNPVFTVGSQIIRVIRQNRKVNKKQAIRIAIEKIELVKIPDPEDIMRCYPHELSGGQRQRIIIAMALSCDAEFLIADEPTRNLDVTIQAGILKLISQLQKDLSVSVLFIANNLGLVAATCDQVAILHKGKIVESGETKHILKTPQHPYTKALIHAIPKDKHDKIEITNCIPKVDLNMASNGCQVIELCPDRDEKCRQTAPMLSSVGGTHLVACHHITEPDNNPKT